MNWSDDKGVEKDLVETVAAWVVGLVLVAGCSGGSGQPAPSRTQSTVPPAPGCEQFARPKRGPTPPGGRGGPRGIFLGDGEVRGCKNSDG